MRLGNPSIPLFLCLAATTAPRLAAGQTEPTTGTAEAAVTVDADAAATPAEPVTAPDEPVAAPDQPAPPATPTPAGTEEERPWAAPPPPPSEPPPQTQPAQPGWGGQPAQPWGDPNAPATQPAWGGEGGEWSDSTVFSLPEDQLLGYWPVVAELGVGYGLTAEGSLRLYNSAITLEPSAFLGLLPLWGMFQGPTLAVPIGMPGSYTKTVRGDDVTIDHGLSVGIVPGYRILHPFRRDMFWAAGLGVPFLISEWQPSAKRDYTFTPGLEINAEYAYKFLAGLGVFIRATYQVYFGTYTLSTFGGTIGLVLYWEWFDDFAQPTPPADALQDQEAW
ncbi:MAG: hypothetical protein JXB32_16995 [Deltaproteobacteria bacterium]|nr:hypothetical protein [Deltaproteobacteria bacterium]